MQKNVHLTLLMKLLRQVIAEWKNRVSFCYRRIKWQLTDSGLAIIGLCLTRRSEEGRSQSMTMQKAFDFNEVQDITYKYIATTNDDGWLLGARRRTIRFAQITSKRFRPHRNNEVGNLRCCIGRDLYPPSKSTTSSWVCRCRYYINIIPEIPPALPRPVHIFVVHPPYHYLHTLSASEVKPRNILHYICSYGIEN